MRRDVHEKVAGHARRRCRSMSKIGYQSNAPSSAMQFGQTSRASGCHAPSSQAPQRHSFHQASVADHLVGATPAAVGPDGLRINTAVMPVLHGPAAHIMHGHADHMHGCGSAPHLRDAPCHSVPYPSARALDGDGTPRQSISHSGPLVGSDGLRINTAVLPVMHAPLPHMQHGHADHADGFGSAPHLRDLPAAHSHYASHLSAPLVGPDGRRINTAILPVYAPMAHMSHAHADHMAVFGSAPHLRDLAAPPSHTAPQCFGMAVGQDGLRINTAILPSYEAAAHMAHRQYADHCDVFSSAPHLRDLSQCHSVPQACGLRINDAVLPAMHGPMAHIQHGHADHMDAVGGAPHLRDIAGSHSVPYPPRRIW